MNTREKPISRRRFLKTVALSSAAVACPFLRAESEPGADAHEALFYDSLENNDVRCGLCPRNCVVAEGLRGKCGVRENREGTYYTLVYGKPVAIHNDPIEKKPFVHVYPGTRAFSIATVGCNLRCKFCQNWEISQAGPGDVVSRTMAPKDIVAMALDNQARTVAYTYTEPVIFYEYMFDCAREAKAAGLGNLMVSNGFISDNPLKKLLPLMTAVKVDLKSFSNEFYRNICDGLLDPILRTMKTVVDCGVWLEIVVLLIPTLNDNEDELKRMTEWINKKLGPNVPLNFIRFYPLYRLRNLPATPQQTLQMAHDIAVRQGLNFVYATGVAGTTLCPVCKTPLVERFRDVLIKNSMTGPECPKCGESIPGVWV